jgi:pilus assembly protein CpaB
VTAQWLDRLPEPVRRVVAIITWHQRLVVAGLVAIAVASALSTLAPAAPRVVRVLAAAADLPAGTTLTRDELHLVGLPPTALPAGALRTSAAAVGRVLAAPMRRDEPLTDVRLVGSALIATLAPDEVATPVRIADPGVTRLLHPGDVVDVLAARTDATSPVASSAEVVATDVRVLAVPAPTTDASGADDGALIVLAMPQSSAARLAAAAVADRLTVTIHP